MGTPWYSIPNEGCQRRRDRPVAIPIARTRKRSRAPGSSTTDLLASPRMATRGPAGRSSTPSRSRSSFDGSPYATSIGRPTRFWRATYGTCLRTRFARLAAITPRRSDGQLVGGRSTLTDPMTPCVSTEAANPLRCPAFASAETQAGTSRDPGSSARRSASPAA
jgi:hypothetical protein